MDIKRLRQLVRAALNRNVSIKKLLQIMGDALAGLYHARGYESSDIDLVSIVHSIGGSKLLYAVSHAAGLPSLRTLKRQRKLIALRPCIGSIQASEIDHNLRELFGNDDGDPSDRVITGHSILIDEIALEERVRYLPSKDLDNEIVGICREHGGKTKLRIDPESVDRLADLLDEGTCHIGREATVAAIASFGSDNYHAMPFLISPTCKMEQAPEQAEWIKLSLDRWRELFGDTYGPIWSVSTDGDGTRRAALHSLLMTKSLDPTGDLYKILGLLPGLNLETGESDIIMDGDPKHIIKSMYSNGFNWVTCSP